MGHSFMTMISLVLNIAYLFLSDPHVVGDVGEDSGLDEVAFSSLPGAAAL